MSIVGLDVATTTGLAVYSDGEWRVMSFSPTENRPPSDGAIDFAYEGRVFREFEDRLRAVFLAEGVTEVAIERPLRSNVTRKPRFKGQGSFGGDAFAAVGATTMSVIFRLYPLVGHALSLCSRLNIGVHVIDQTQWRTAFRIPTQAPKSEKNSRAWLKKKAKERCGELGISVRNADEAEAVGVAWALGRRLGVLQDPRSAPLLDRGDTG